MSKRVTDIAQIRKYLNGELDARAMHQLERRAQDDPFLMDALEGYQHAKPDQQANLADLTGRLEQRVNRRTARIIPLRTISIAASILIICSAGFWWFYQGNELPVKPIKKETKASQNLVTTRRDTDTMAKTAALPPEQVAANAPVSGVKPATVRRATAQPTVAEANSAPAPVSGISPAPNKDTETAKATEPDTTPLNETIAMNYKSSKTKDTTRRAMLKEVRIRPRQDTAPEQRLIASAPGVQVYPNGQSTAEMDKAITRGNLNGIGVSQLMANRLIQGKVIAQADGLPIQGASVKVAGTNQSTKTDAAGFFKVRADTGHTRLEITGPGYQARRLSTASAPRDSVKTIVLTADKGDDLGETTGADYISAHPQKGWSDFRHYLKSNAISPDGVTGLVKVSFVVDKSGSISNIKVEKGLSDAANKKALSIIKDGPGWMGNSNKRPETITVRIKFGK